MHAPGALSTPAVQAAPPRAAAAVRRAPACPGGLQPDGCQALRCRTRPALRQEPSLGETGRQPAGTGSGATRHTARTCGLISPSSPSQWGPGRADSGENTHPRRPFRFLRSLPAGSAVTPWGVRGVSSCSPETAEEEKPVSLYPSRECLAEALSP